MTLLSCITAFIFLTIAVDYFLQLNPKMNHITLFIIVAEGKESVLASPVLNAIKENQDRIILNSRLYEINCQTTVVNYHIWRVVYGLKNCLFFQLLFQVLKE